MVALTRAFGWHRPSSTPCGKSVPIGEAHALLELSNAPALTQQELAERVNLRKSTVSRLISNLEGRGWVERTRNSDDGRAWDVFLTASGRKAANDLAVARTARMEGILAAIPAGERQSVLASLQTLIEAIHEHDP